ncbi:glycosyltransferase family 4 protein [Gorillibacterium sp. CAU 1737]|uniref:glycosyltransferase family 4 protein n=1 Tax=Gorillibacterium sp. CAU 1737 TaxID=3140362 RepID=UPI0032605480
MATLKVLLACYWPLPHLGGVWPYMLQLKQQLEYRGHTVDIFGNGPDIPKYHMVNQNRGLLKDHILPFLKVKLNNRSYPGINSNSWLHTVELDRYCMELSAAYFGLDSYDVIHSQDVISTLAMSRVKGKHTGLVASIHGSLAREVLYAVEKDNLEGSVRAKISRYYRTLEHYGAVSSDITITSTEWMRNLLIQDFQVPAEQVVSFPYGLDTDTFYQIQALGTERTRPPGKKVIICPARLVSIKGINFLIDALARLKRVRSDWVCWIVGDGDLRKPLQEQAKALGLTQDVLFLGQRKDVPALLTQADIFAHPSLQDNQPFSVMEAQLAGLPCVVSNAGGLPEAVLHNVNGLVSPVGDVATLSDHLHFLLANDESRQRLGQHAAEWAKEHWSLATMTDRMVQQYEAAWNKAVWRMSHA